jgi:hypothetical protein
VVEAGQGGFCRSNASACASHWAAISRKRRSNLSPIGRLLASARACCAFARSSAGVSAGGGSFGMVGERTAKRKGTVQRMGGDETGLRSVGSLTGWGIADAMGIAVGCDRG